MIAQFELIVRKIEARFVSLLALEAWAAAPLLKKGGKGFAQIQKRLIRSILGDFSRPWVVFPPDLVELLLEFPCAWFLTRHRADSTLLTPNSTQIVRSPLAFAK